MVQGGMGKGHEAIHGRSAPVWGLRLRVGPDEGAGG